VADGWRGKIGIRAIDHEAQGVLFVQKIVQAGFERVALSELMDRGMLVEKCIKGGSIEIEAGGVIGVIVIIAAKPVEMAVAVVQGKAKRAMH